MPPDAWASDAEREPVGGILGLGAVLVEQRWIDASQLESAQQEAERSVQQWPVAKTYSDTRSALRDQWVHAHPQAALALLAAERDLPSSERTFTPTAEQRRFLARP